MRLITTIILSILAISSYGQLSKLNGDVTDDQGKALPSSTVVLLSPEDSTMMYFGISNSAGHWEIKNIKTGNYLSSILVASCYVVSYYCIYTNY